MPRGQGDGDAAGNEFDRAPGDRASDPARRRWTAIAGARLTAAVSEAGGFGILGGGYGDKAWLEQETAKLQALQAPFGIGFITWSMAKQPELLDIALDARPRAIMLSFGDPKPFAPRIKAAGALLICQVQSEDMAQAGARCRRRHPDRAGHRGRRPRRLAHHASTSCRRSSISRPGACRSSPPAASPTGAGSRQ